MAREVKSVTIGDCEYAIRHLDVKSARRVLRRVLAAAAPLAGMGDASDLGGVLQQVLASIGDDDLDVISAVFAAETKVKLPQSGGTALPLDKILDDHFAGAGLSRYLEWLKASLDHNFADFFVDLRAQVGDLMVGETAPKSPNTSTGGSTE